MADTITKIQPSDLISDSMDKINRNFEIISNRDDVVESKLNQWAERIENQLADIQNENGIISDTLLNNVQKLENKIDNVTNLDGIAKEVQNIVNNASTDVEKLINDKAGEAISSRLGDYVKTSTLNKTLGGYVSSTAFDTYRSDSSKSSAQSSRIVANSKFLKLPNGDIDCLVRISGEITTFESVEDYFKKGLPAADKAAILGDKTFDSDDEALEDPDVVAKLIEVCETTFKTVVSEMSVISQSVGPDNVENTIIATVKNGKTGKDITASIFTKANKDGSEIALNADNINIDGKHALTVKSGGNINIQSGGKFQVKSGNFSIDEKGTVTVKGAIEAKSLKITGSDGSMVDISDETKLANFVKGHQDDKWLKDALNNGTTTIDGGLVLSNAILTKDSDDNITAGIIGSNNTENDIRFFAGTSSTDLSDIENAPFKVLEDGTLIATKANISGTIAATQFEAEYKQTSDLTKITILNGEKFSIRASGKIGENDVTGNSLYIRILDSLNNNNSSIVDNNGNQISTLYGVPALCMSYGGKEYILSPASWLQGAVYNRYMKWIDTYDVHNWEFNEDSLNTNTYTSGNLKDNNTTIGTYYAFSPDNENNFISNYKFDKLYQFNIAQLDPNDPKYDEYLQLLLNHKLISDKESKKCPFVLKSNITDETSFGETIIINDSNCSKFGGYLRSTLTTSTAGGASQSTNKATPDLFNFNSALKIIKKIICMTYYGGQKYKWYNGNTEVSISGADSVKLTPYLGDTTSNTNMANNPSVNTENDKISVRIDYYPIFTISNYGQTIGDTTDTMLVKLKYTVTCDYNSSTTVNVNNTSITPQNGTFEFEFYSVFKLNTPCDFLINPGGPASDPVFVFISKHLKDIDCDALGFGEFIFKGRVTTNNPTYSTIELITK